MRNKFLFLCLLLFGTLTACKDTKWVDVPTGTPPEGAITGKPGEPEEPDNPTVKSFINCSYIWGIERSGFFNGREKWAKGFENQRV